MKTTFHDKYRMEGVKGLPKYAELREIMRAAISDGFWQEGEQIPSEMEITRVTPYSLGTVQKALKALETEGVLQRRPGHGTFVTDQRATMVDPWHLRFCRPDESYLPVYPSVVSKRLVRPTTSWAELLSPGGKLIQIDRKMNIGDEFWVYNRFFLSADRHASFLQKSNKELSSLNFKTILHRECNISFTGMSYKIQVTSFPDAVSRVLRMAKGAVGLLLEILADSERAPVYFQEIYIPQNKFKLCITDKSTLPKSMS